MLKEIINAELWTIEDVKRFGKFRSRNKIYDAIRDGLPVIRTGRSIRFRPESVVQYFNSKEVCG